MFCNSKLAILVTSEDIYIYNGILLCPCLVPILFQFVGPLATNPSLTGEECFREAQEILQESLDPDPDSWIQEKIFIGLRPAQ